MRPRPAQVAEDGGVGAAGVFQGVGKDGEAGGVKGAGGQGAVVVGGLGQREDRGRPTGGGEGDVTEGVA